jgi:hypothetical protein
MTSAGNTPHRVGSSTKGPRSTWWTVRQKQVPTGERLRIFAKYAAERACILRSLNVALVVGTVLALINHYSAILSATLDAVQFSQILLTYGVPFSVSIFGSASQAVEMELAGRSKNSGLETFVKTSKILTATSLSSLREKEGLV